MQWHAVNVYTQDHQDDCILELIAPWTERLADDTPVHFVRHWQGGPHVSFRVGGPLATFQDESGPAWASEASAWMSGRPDEAGFTDESVLRRLAEVEEHAELSELQQPGTVRLVGDVPRRTQAMGGEAAANLYESYLTASHGHAIDGVRLAAQHGRIRLAFDAMATAPNGLIGDITRFFLSFRSHADGFLMNTPDPEATRAFFERSYQSRKDALVARIHELVDGVDDPSAHWGRASTARLHAFMDRAADGLASGSLAPARSPETDEDARARLRHSAFHRTAHAGGIGRALENTPRFQAYRLAINYLYADITRLGLTGIERFLTCHLVSRAVEDAFGIDATEELAKTELGHAEAGHQG